MSDVKDITMSVAASPTGVAREADEATRKAARKRLWRRRRASAQLYFSAGMGVLIVMLCFLGPTVFRAPSPIAENLITAQARLFAHGHLLGSDDLGRDLLSRSLYGGQISIEVGLGSVGLGLLIGSTLGMLAAFFGGKLDSLIMRVLDMLLAFPALVLALAIASYLGPNERDEIFAIAFFTIPAFARFTRAATMRLLTLDFLEASSFMGGGARHQLLRHVAPNVAGSVLTFALVTVASAMLTEAGLSFLGAGIRPPEASWGNMIAEGQGYLSLSPTIVLVPAAFLFITVLVLNLLGDALRMRSDR